MVGDPLQVPKCPVCNRGMNWTSRGHFYCNNPDCTSKIKKLVFRIRERYYDQIVADTKKIEYRRDIPFWQTRLANIFSKEAIQGNFQLSCNLSGVEAQAVFICGKRKHTRELVGVERLKTPDYFSEQGKKDVNTPTCLGFHLGEVS